MRTWKTEHPKSEVPQEIYTHTQLNDISWKNDSCPSFEVIDSEGETTGHHVWVDYEDVQMRDVKEYKRYSIVHCSIEEDITTVLDTDDLNEILNFLKTLQKSN